MSKSRKERQRHKRRQQQRHQIVSRTLPGVDPERLKVVDSADLGLRKISECLLELAAPLFEPLGDDPVLEEAEAAMNLAVSIWNAVLMDAKGANYIDALREKAGALDPELVPFLDRVIETRRTRFADDRRMVVGIEFVRHDGALTLNASALLQPPPSAPGGDDDADDDEGDRDDRDGE